MGSTSPQGNVVLGFWAETFVDGSTKGNGLVPDAVSTEPSARGGKEGWSGRDPENSIRGIADFEELAEIFHGSVVDTKAGANAGLARVTCELCEDTVADGRGVRQTEAGRERIVFSGREGARNAGITG